MRTPLALLILSLAAPALAFSPAALPTEGRQGGVSCDDGPVREEVVRELVRVIEGVERRLCRQGEQALAQSLVCDRLDRASRPEGAASAGEGGGAEGSGECPSVRVESRGLFSGRQATAPGNRAGQNDAPPLLRREELQNHKRSFRFSDEGGAFAVRPGWLENGAAPAVTEGEFRAAFRRAVSARSAALQPADGGSCVSCNKARPSRRPKPDDTTKEGIEPIGGSTVGP